MYKEIRRCGRKIHFRERGEDPLDKLEFYVDYKEGVSMNEEHKERIEATLVKDEGWPIDGKSLEDYWKKHNIPHFTLPKDVEGFIFRCVEPRMNIFADPYNNLFVVRILHRTVRTQLNIVNYMAIKKLLLEEKVNKNSKMGSLHLSLDKGQAVGFFSMQDADDICPDDVSVGYFFNVDDGDLIPISNLDFLRFLKMWQEDWTEYSNDTFTYPIKILEID